MLIYMGNILDRQAKDNDKEKKILGIIHVYHSREDRELFQ